MTTVIQLLVSGIASGLIYGIVGMEYTLIWNSTGLLNFSHDKMITLGAYFFAAQFVANFALNYPIAAVGAIAAMALFGLFMASVIFIPLRNMDRMCAILGTIMLGRIINEGIRIVWGPLPYSATGLFSGTINIFGATVSAAYIYILVIALVIATSLQLFMTKTRLGKAMQCVSQNKMAASLMGIDVVNNMRITIMLSVVICSILGIMVIPLFGCDGNMANMIGQKGFSAGVIGGFGNLPAAILGGVIIGVVENIGCMFVPSLYKDAISFILMIAFMLIKPSGLIAKK